MAIRPTTCSSVTHTTGSSAPRYLGWTGLQHRAHRTCKSAIQSMPIATRATMTAHRRTFVSFHFMDCSCWCASIKATTWTSGVHVANHLPVRSVYVTKATWICRKHPKRTIVPMAAPKKRRIKCVDGHVYCGHLGKTAHCRRKGQMNSEQANDGKDGIYRYSRR